MLNFDLPKFLGVILSEAPRAGDVLLAVGVPPQVQVDGSLVRLQLPGLERLTPFQTEAVVAHLLAQASPAVKKIVLTACAHTVAADGLIQSHEAELLRAIGDTLDCPIPPFVEGV